MYFNYKNNNYEIVIETKHNKHLYIRITDDLKIKITKPYCYTLNMVKKIINENEKQISNMLEKTLKRNLSKQDNNIYIFDEKINVIIKDIKRPEVNLDNIYVRDYKMFNKWYLNKAKLEFEKELKTVYNCFEEEIPYPKLKIRNMKTRWGVCNRKDNSITLNLKLLTHEKKYLDYVIIHELSHFVYFDHSKNFWNLVFKYCKDYKQIKGEMKLW